MLATAQNNRARCICLTVKVSYSYRGATGPDAEEEEALKLLVVDIDCDADLAQFSASAAAAVDTGKELAKRQEAALESASQDLLCSPDIIRCPDPAVPLNHTPSQPCICPNTAYPFQVPHSCVFDDACETDAFANAAKSTQSWRPCAYA